MKVHLGVHGLFAQLPQLVALHYPFPLPGLDGIACRFFAALFHELLQLVVDLFKPLSCAFEKHLPRCARGSPDADSPLDVVEHCRNEADLHKRKHSSVRILEGVTCILLELIELVLDFGNLAHEPDDMSTCADGLAKGHRARNGAQDLHGDGRGHGVREVSQRPDREGKNEAKKAGSGRRP